MTKKRSAPRPKNAVNRPTPASPMESSFDEIVTLIHQPGQRNYQAVNAELVDLYWRIGEYLHFKIDSEGWAKGTVVKLAAYIALRQPNRRGFSSQNLWRMRQFFEAYRDRPILSTLLRELPWSAHLHILSRAKRQEERGFHLRTAAQNRWPVREVARQIQNGLFEQAVLSPPRLSTALRDMHPQADSQFKDVYPAVVAGLRPRHA